MLVKFKVMFKMMVKNTANLCYNAIMVFSPLLGTASRTVASTNMNATSSRAHTVVTITFDQFIKTTSSESKKSSILNLVDLAGKSIIIDL